MSDKANQITTLLQPTVQALGLELLGVEYAPTAGRALLRLYIDVPVSGGGAQARMVGIEDCEAVSREVSATLDVEDPIAAQYTLEVSSPGVERPLFTAAHFRRFLGQRAKITLRLPQQGRRRLQGVIAQVDGETISIGTDQGDIDLAIGNIERARLVPDWSALGLAPKPKPGRGGKASLKQKTHPNMKPTAPPPSSGADE